MFSPKPSTTERDYDKQVSVVLAAELGMEYALLRVGHNLPTGMYLTPSLETILHWSGVFFVHRGPYASAVLRFSILFPASFPQKPPVVRFDTDVYHPMIDPKTMIWIPTGSLARWQPRKHHVAHVLRSVKRSFRKSYLDEIEEHQAINKHLWSLYHHSNHTFISMTAQRSLSSASASTLFPDTMSMTTADISTPPSTPSRVRSPAPGMTGVASSPSRQGFTSSPSTPLKAARTRLHSGTGSVRSHQSAEEEDGTIRFKPLGEEERARRWSEMVKSTGPRLVTEA